MKTIIINTKKKKKIRLIVISIIFIIFGINTIGHGFGFTLLCAANTPPNIPSNPKPYNGSTDVELNTTLVWSGGDLDGNIVTYDIYFSTGESNQMDLVSNDQSNTIYYLSDVLSYNSIYYWQIVAVDENGTSSIGPIWSFTTKNITDNISYCRDLGYFIDENSDGIYDLFYSNQTRNITDTYTLEDGSYLINNDMDIDWDYTYNLQTGVLSSYSSENAPPKKLDNTIYYMLIIGMIFVIIFLIAISLGKKVKKK